LSAESDFVSPAGAATEQPDSAASIRADDPFILSIRRSSSTVCATSVGVNAEDSGKPARKDVTTGKDDIFKKSCQQPMLAKAAAGEFCAS
jgi:hypothetical protein